MIHQVKGEAPVAVPGEGTASSGGLPLRPLKEGTSAEERRLADLPWISLEI